MSALEITITALKAAPAVAAIVGDGESPEAFRIHAFEVPQAFARPCLVASLLSESEDQMVGGAGGYFESRVQVQCLADDPAGANDLGEVVKAALSDITKQAIAGATSVDIWKAGADYTDVSADRAVYRRILDFYVRWRS